MNDSRKLAIKNLKGSDEEMRVAWMLKNMSENKTFKYLLKDKKFRIRINKKIPPIVRGLNLIISPFITRTKPRRKRICGTGDFPINKEEIKIIIQPNPKTAHIILAG